MQSSQSVLVLSQSTVTVTPRDSGGAAAPDVSENLADNYYVSLYQQSLLSPTAAEEAKNAHAVERVTTILREAAWINTHLLPVSPTHNCSTRF